MNNDMREKNMQMNAQTWWLHTIAQYYVIHCASVYSHILLVLMPAP